MKKTIFLISMFLSLQCQLLAATYYVDPAGDDLDDGSMANPFATIQKASDMAQSPGDEVCINDGTYLPGNSTQRYTGSGTAGNPITFRNCEGGDVIIDPSTHITSWTSLGGNLWESDNGTVGTTSYVWKDTTWLGVGLANAACASVNAQDEWCVSSNGRIQTYSTTDPALATYRIARVCFQMWNVKYITFDGLKLRWVNFGYNLGYPNSGSPTPTQGTSNIIIKNGEVGYTGSRGLRIIGSILYPTDHIYVENMEIHDSHDSAATPINGHCIKFDSNDDGYHNSYAYVTDSHIYNCELEGIQFSDGWQHGYFSGNEIHNISTRSDGVGAGIRCGDTFHCYIWDNFIYGGTGSFGSGIYLNEKAQPSYVWNNQIQGFNYYGVFTGKQAKNPADLHIFNNIIQNNNLGCIYISDTIGFYLYGNTCYNNGNPQMQLSSNGNTGGVVKNNIIHSTSNRTAMQYKSTNDMIEDYNLVKASVTGTMIYDGTTYTLANYQVASGQGAHSIVADPLFVTNGSDFHLQVTSPAINAGISVGEDYDFDFDEDVRPQGYSWDMGAYEYTIPSYGMKGGATTKTGAKLS